MDLNGDVLETFFSHVPLVHLISASHVSKTWRAAVSSSLRHRNRPRPWLILHTQSTRAYDPRSGVWISITSGRPPAVRSSHSGFAYALSPFRLSFSADPLGLDWRHVDPPLVWRQDPIVARVGGSVVVAGGGCDFEDDPLAVEIYDLDLRAWRTCDSMPAALRGSAASARLSIAAVDEKLFVADKESGLTHWFDPATETWSEPLQLNPTRPVCSYHIGFTINNKTNTLILVGLCRIEDVGSVKIWRVDGDDYLCREMGEMPVEFVERLRSERFGYCSLNVRAAGDTVYVYNDAWDVEEVVACEFDGGGCGGCRWWSLRIAAARGGMTADNGLVFTCAEVGIDALRRVVDKGRFEVSPMG